jgi:hypothetical protein
VYRKRRNPLLPEGRGGQSRCTTQHHPPPAAAPPTYPITTNAQRDEQRPVLGPLAALAALSAVRCRRCRAAARPLAAERGRQAQSVACVIRAGGTTGGLEYVVAKSPTSSMRRSRPTGRRGSGCPPNRAPEAALCVRLEQRGWGRKGSISSNNSNNSSHSLLGKLACTKIAIIKLLLDPRAGRALRHAPLGPGMLLGFWILM